MSKKVMVKKHVRHGVTIDAHEREVIECENDDLNKKLKLESETKKKREKMRNLFFSRR